MTSKRLVTALALSALSVPLLACFTKRVVTTHIQHPMHTGTVEANRVPVEYPAAERQRGLPPGSLNQEAVLTQLDANGLCFELTFHQIDQTYAPDATDYEVALDVGENLRVVQPTYTPREGTVQTFQGLNPVEVQYGRENVCTNRDDNGNCSRWEQRPLTRTEYHPGPVTVAEGGGTLCFSNEGYVTTETEMVALVLSRTAQNYRFEWALESAVQ